MYFSMKIECLKESYAFKATIMNCTTEDYKIWYYKNKLCNNKPNLVLSTNNIHKINLTKKVPIILIKSHLIIKILSNINRKILDLIKTNLIIIKVQINIIIKIIKINLEEGVDNLILNFLDHNKIAINKILTLH